MKRKVYSIDSSVLHMVVFDCDCAVAARASFDLVKGNFNFTNSTLPLLDAIKVQFQFLKLSKSMTNA